MLILAIHSDIIILRYSSMLMLAIHFFIITLKLIIDVDVRYSLSYHHTKVDHPC